MLYTNSTNIVVPTNTNITLNTNEILTGCTVTHTVNTPNINLNKCGYYMVHFNADVTGATGDVKVQMYGNNTKINGAVATETISTSTDVSNISFETIVRVQPNCRIITTNCPLTLTFLNSGIATTFNNVSVVVTKLC